MVVEVISKGTYVKKMGIYKEKYSSGYFAQYEVYHCNAFTKSLDVNNSPRSKCLHCDISFDFLISSLLPLLRPQLIFAFLQTLKIQSSSATVPVELWRHRGG